MKHTFNVNGTIYQLDNCLVLAIFAISTLVFVNKVAAIKLLREYFNSPLRTIGLKDAKDLVEFIWSDAKYTQQGINFDKPIPAVYHVSNF